MSSSGNNCENDRLLFTNTILAEVKKRPMIWQKKHPSYNSRQTLLDAWAEIGKSVGVTYDVARARWRCLRDLFQKEMRRLQAQQEKGGDIRNLRLWLHFRSMLFLKNEYPSVNLSLLEDDGTKETPDSLVEVKVESNYDESSRDADRAEFIQSEPELQLYPDIDPISRSDVNNDSESSRDFEARSARKRKIKTERDDEGSDEDMLFVRSLVPFLRGMDRVKKLRLRSKIQNLIADELM